MLQVGDKVISMDVLERMFVCDLDACKGQCCVQGESGAPLEDEEVALLEKHYVRLKPFLRKEGIRAIEKQGAWVMDKEEDKVTPLVEGMECAYAIFRDGIARCGIEHAYEKKAIPFRKPISCHLYPVRITRYENFEAVNHDSNKLCKSAEILGRKKGTPAYMFLKEALERKYGKPFFRKLDRAARELREKGDIQ